jgi:hypothetical protein
MLAKLKGLPVGFLPALVLLTALTVPCGQGLSVSPAFAKDEPQQPDETMGNAGSNMRTGTNDRGDSVMVIERQPPKQQEMPTLGPIYVMPQVNQGGGANPPVIIPVNPSQPGAQPGALPNAPQGSQQGQ